MLKTYTIQYLQQNMEATYQTSSFLFIQINTLHKGFIPAMK